MIKYFLVPAEITIENGEESRNAKYVDTIRANWSGVYIKDLDKYIIVVNTKEQGKIDKFLKKLDITELNGSRETKDKLTKDLKLNKTIEDNEDEIDVLGKMEVPDFDKNKLSVVSD